MYIYIQSNLSYPGTTVRKVPVTRNLSGCQNYYAPHGNNKIFLFQNVQLFPNGLTCSSYGVVY